MNMINRLAEDPKNPTQVPDGDLSDGVGKTPGDFIDENEEDADDDYEDDSDED